MKLQYFSEQTFPKASFGREGTAKITFGKAGTVALNQQACDLIKIKGGEKLTICQDPDHPENWYLFKDGNHGFATRTGYSKKGLILNHGGLVKKVISCFDLSIRESHSFKVAGTPTIIEKSLYWGILIMAPLAE